MNKYDWSNKKLFILDLKNSGSIADFLKLKNITVTSGNYYTFNKWVKKHGINIETTFNNKKLNTKRIFKNIQMEDLCKNSTISKKQLISFINKKNIIKYECSCSNKGFWNGNPLTLQLEHKNGNNNDNRLENLEYLCPNCHSQTSTYGSRNKHNKVFDTRIKDLIKIKKINEKTLIHLSKMWKISCYSVECWIKKYLKKILINNIEIDIKSIKFYINERNKEILKKIKINNDDISYKNISKEYNISIQQIKKIIKDMDLILYNNIKKNKKPQYKNDKLKNNIIKRPLHTDFKKEINSFDKQKRVEDVSILTNKKQVLDLSKKWKISVNGAKKWIKNNLPDKFKEIYDDKHLERNKKKVLHEQKINYLESLEENFNEKEAMKFLNINKTTLYAQIKAHNLNLLEKMHSQHLCPKCNYKTRTNGQYRRCLACDYNFKPKLNINI